MKNYGRDDARNSSERKLWIQKEEQEKDGKSQTANLTHSTSFLWEQSKSLCSVIDSLHGYHVGSDAHVDGVLL